MVWEKGKLQKAVLTSNIGGTLRIRSAFPLYLDGEKLEPAAENMCKNQLLQPQDIRKPLIAANAPLTVPQYAATYVYDIETTAGNQYVLTVQNP